MRNTLKKIICYVMLNSLIIASFVGCGGKRDKTSEENVSETTQNMSEDTESSESVIDSTTESGKKVAESSVIDSDVSEEDGYKGNRNGLNQEYISGNNETTEFVVDSTIESGQKVNESSIIGSGCALEANPVADNAGLYQMEFSELTSESWITDMRTCGDNLLILVEKYGEDGLTPEYTLYLISPLDMNIIGECKLSGSWYYNDNIFIDDENNIAVADTEHGNVHFYDQQLNEYSVVETGKDELTGCFVSSDFSKIYITEQYNNVFCYDVNDGTLTQLFAQATEGYGESVTVSIAGLWTDKDLIMLNIYDEDTVSYDVRNISTGESVAFDAISVSFFQGKGDGYVARADVDGLNEIMFRNSEADGDKLLALPTYDEYGNVYINAGSNMIITDVEEESVSGDTKTVRLNAYNRTTGKKENASEFIFKSSEGIVYLGNITVIDSLNIAVLNLQTGVFVWDLADDATRTEDEKCYAKNSNNNDVLSKEDYADLREIADDIGSRYSVEVYFGDDVNDCSRDIYEYVPANNGVRISQSLGILDSALSRYPEGMFEELAQGEGGILKIYLSGQILAADESAITTAVGVQNTGINDTYIVLDIYSTVDYEKSIYHEICHALEKYMESEGYYYDYDQWQACNPEGFDYDYDYIANVDNCDWSYVIDDYENGVYFIDTYSKSFPNEDRARIMEYAMIEEENHTAYFQNEGLANKLRCISSMLREGFDDSDWPEVTSWEEVLAY